MSSEAITRNDLKAILEQCGMSGMAFQEAAVLRVTDKVITNTTTAEIKPDSCTVYGNANVLSTDGTYLTINKTCPCIIIKTLGISTTAQPTYIKVFNICERSNPTIPLGVNAAARLNTWEAVTASDIVTLNENDVISLHGRADDGNITLYNCRAIIIPIDDKVDTTTYDLCPDYIVVQPSEDLTFSTNETTVVNLNTISRSNGSKLTFDASSHAIVVGEGVKFVEVSGAAYILTWGNTAAKNVYIYVNDVCYGRTTGYINTNYNSLVISSVIVPVSEGDLVTLRFNPSNNSTSVLGHDTSDNGATTFLQVKVADMSGKISVSLPEDYIIEEGTTDGWAWRKWNNGKMEAEKDISSGSAWTSIGTGSVLYYNSTTITPPTGMTVTYGYANLKQESTYVTGAQIQVATNIILMIHRLASSSATFNCHVVLCGTWK